MPNEWIYAATWSACRFGAKLRAVTSPPDAPVWPDRLLADSPWFAALRPTLIQLGWSRFPHAEAWSALPSSLRPHNRAGRPIRFIDPAHIADTGYEQHIADAGEVATRPDNWHDTFNALCWLAWPRTKAALNALHLRELATQQGSLRSRARDAATLVDESGLVLACADPALADALHAHDWPRLFQHRREAWGKHLAPYLLGHALLEKGLSPFIGTVAKVIVLDVAPAWFALDEGSRIADLDRRLAALVDDGALANPRSLPPMPVLGIPGWWSTQDDDFYADTRHFRPKRLAIRPS